MHVPHRFPIALRGSATIVKVWLIIVAQVNGQGKSVF